jgi:hypothetical protein
MNSSAIVWAGTFGASCVIFLACWQPWKPRPRHTARAVEQAIAREHLMLPPPLVGSMQVDEDRDWPGRTGDPLTDWAHDPDDRWVERLNAELADLEELPTLDGEPVYGVLPADAGSMAIPPVVLPAGPVLGPAGAQPCPVCGSLPVPIHQGTPPVLVKYGPACGCDERLAETGDLAAVARRLDYDAELETREVSHAAFMAELSYAWDRLKAASFHITIEKGNRR